MTRYELLGADGVAGVDVLQALLNLPHYMEP
jgi:hypothetical protein